MQYYLPWRGNGRLISNECSSFPIPHRFSVVENAGLRKSSWLTSRRDDPAREETVRLSFKPRQMSTYSPAVWRSRKLHTVTAGTLKIKSVRIELLIPNSGWGLGLLVCHVISTVGESGPAASPERELRKFYASTCSWNWALAHSLMDSQWLSCSPEVGVSLQPRNIHIPPRPDVVTLCNSVNYGILLTWVCRVWWLAGAAFIFIHSSFNACIYPSIYSTVL